MDANPDSSIVACAGVQRTNQRGRNSENLHTASQPESEPNEAPHYARVVIAAHFGLVAIPGENAIGVRVREKESSVRSVPVANTEN